LIPVLIKGDTTEFNAEAFRPIEGSMLEELLKRLPGVEVDKDGKITANGKDIQKILVEGEIFFSDNPQIALKNLPADYVKTVQVYDRKSDDARFTGVDDGKEEMVLNIKLKPEIKMGWFGRLTLGGGWDASNNFRYTNNININSFRGSDQLTIMGTFNNADSENVFVQYGASGEISSMTVTRGATGGMSRTISPMINFVKKFDSKWSLRGSYSYRNGNSEAEQSTYREDISPNGSQFNSDTLTNRLLSHNHSFNAEIKYTPNERNELTVRPNISFGNNSTNRHSIFEMTDDTLAMINRGVTRNSSENLNSSVSLGIDYGYRFAKPKRTMRFSSNGSLNITDVTMYNHSLRHFAVLPSDTLNQRVTNTSGRYNWFASVFYTEPLVRDFTFNLRYNITNSKSKNDRTSFNYDPIAEVYDQIDSAYSNNSGNYHLSHNLVASISKNTEKYLYNVGIGAMPSTNSSYIEGQSDVSQTVLNFAPQAMFRYSFSKQTSLTLNYYASTNQPSVHQLQPLPNNSDPRNIFIGNPNLKREFNHRLGASFNKSFENFSSISTNFSFNTTQNRITNILIYNPNLFPNIQYDSSAFFQGTTRINMADNVGSVYGVSGWLTYSTPLFSKKITLNTTTNGNFNNSKSVIDKDINVLTGLTLSENLRITYRRERFDVSLNGRFNARNTRYSLQSERNNINSTTSGGADFSWQIIKGKLILSSDVNYRMERGLYAGYDFTSTLWNAQLAWNIGKTNDLQLRFRIDDILNDRKDTHRSVSETFIQDITYKNTLRRFFMFSLIYNKRQNTAGSSSPPPSQLPFHLPPGAVTLPPGVVISR
jgi:hypothetical protein